MVSPLETDQFLDLPVPGDGRSLKADVSQVGVALDLYDGNSDSIHFAGLELRDAQAHRRLRLGIGGCRDVGPSCPVQAGHVGEAARQGPGVGDALAVGAERLDGGECGDEAHGDVGSRIPDEAPRPAAPIRILEIDSRNELGVVVRREGVGAGEVERPCRVGPGKEGQKPLRHRIDPVCRNSVVGERSARGRIHQGGGETALPFSIGGNDPRQRTDLPDGLVLVRDEEPSPVPSVQQAGNPDRPPQGGPYLVALVLLLLGLEEVAGVQVVVAVKPEQVAVKVVAPASGDRHDLSSGADPVLGPVEAGLDLEFLQGVGAGLEVGKARKQRPVHIGDVVPLPHPLDPDVPHGASRGAGAAGGSRPRSQGRQLGEVARIQRHVFQFLAADDLSQLGVLRFQLETLRPGAADIVPVSGQQIEVLANRLSHLKQDSGAHLFLVSAQTHSDLIVADGHPVQAVVAVRRAQSHEDFVGLNPGEGQFDAAEGPILTVPHGSQESSGPRLCGDEVSGQEQESCSQNQDEGKGVRRPVHLRCLMASRIARNPRHHGLEPAVSNRRSRDGARENECRGKLRYGRPEVTPPD